MAAISHEHDSVLTDFMAGSDRNSRREATRELFQEYLLPDQNRQLLQILGYTPNQIEYISPLVKFIDLPHFPTDKGLLARPSQTSESSPASLVESPAAGIGEFTTTLPAKLDWVARNQMSNHEIKSLVEMGALTRLTMIDPVQLVDLSQGVDDQRDLYEALHKNEIYPRFGLWPDKGVSRLLRAVGVAATYQTKFVNGDFHINLTNPGTPEKNEIWRPLPNTKDRLIVYGRVPEVTK